MYFFHTLVSTVSVTSPAKTAIMVPRLSVKTVTTLAVDVEIAEVMAEPISFK